MKAQHAVVLSHVFTLRVPPLLLLLLAAAAAAACCRNRSFPAATAAICCFPLPPLLHAACDIRCSF